MNDSSMRKHIDQVLEDMSVARLEDRIAPVKCEKTPDHPECLQTLYGIEPAYGIEPMYGIEPE